MGMTLKLTEHQFCHLQNEAINADRVELLRELEIIMDVVSQ